MAPEEAKKVRLAARLIAARAQDDRLEAHQLLGQFSETSIQYATDGLIMFSHPCAELLAKATGVTFDDAINSVSRICGRLIPVSADWNEILRLISCLRAGKEMEPRSIDIPTALEAAFSVAFSLVAKLSDVTGYNIDYIASLMSEAAEREM